MTAPILTIGIATVDDYDGLWATISALMFYHADAMRQCELLIVDQNATSEIGKASCRYARKLRGRTERGELHSIRYVADTGTRGIGPARNNLFAEAAGEYVLALDSHVMLIPGAVNRLLAHHQEHPACNDLLTGPLHSDGGGFVGTHQLLHWRNGALGIWAHGEHADPRASDRDGDPYEIPMQGLGCFSCRRSAFPGFHRNQRGFGCAEALFCQKFRDRGDSVLCFPALAWLHRWGYVKGRPYEALSSDKVANYILEFAATGCDPSGLFDHFKGQMNELDRERLFETLKGVKA